MSRIGNAHLPSCVTPPIFTSSVAWHRRSAGFGLVEVLVTALLIGVAVLGMAALQARAVGYTTETIQRGTAAMLAADLLELARAAPSAWTRYLQSDSLNPGAQPCTTTPSLPREQLACWLAELAASLPGSRELPAGSSYICLSPSAGQCARQGVAIEVQVAWKSRHCLPCQIRLRSEIQACWMPPARSATSRA
ncbi:MAG: type IV pilus modification protein PilV [Pseudomonas sp.]